MVRYWGGEVRYWGCGEVLGRRGEVLGRRGAHHHYMSRVLSSLSVNSLVCYK